MVQNFTINNQYIIEKYKAIRSESVSLIANLSAEDCQLQATNDVSPMKWHLAHTSWFFEAFLLTAVVQNYRCFDDSFKLLFNSYYNGIGEQFSRAQRGLLSRPTLQQVLAYREHVDQAVCRLVEQQCNDEAVTIITLGLQHEQQHQELMLMDIKYNFSINPLFPAYKTDKPSHDKVVSERHYLAFEKTITTIGADLSCFSYDNERPAHEVIVPAFLLANSLVTNGEYLEFINTDGYNTAQFWHSDGWAHLQEKKHCAPLYWHKTDDQWYEFTLYGLQPLNLDQPVCHVSYFEASAFAAYAGARLPTEFEWERAMRSDQQSDLHQLSSSCWQWTNSAYLPYPGFQPFAGIAGEYNGKFMSNQMVLRGGSAFTANDHTRYSYRNFFYPHQAWMRSGIRLAKDLL